jgi:hypothetical protein
MIAELSAVPNIYGLADRLTSPETESHSHQEIFFCWRCTLKGQQFLWTQHMRSLQTLRNQ